MQDQTIRQLLPDAEKRFGRKSEEYKWFRNNLMSRNDSIILHKIKEIIDKEGWLGIDEVGELANQTIWLVIQHAPLSIQNQYLPLLEESVNAGKSKAEQLAFLKDRILMRKGLKQVYGTQSIWNDSIKKNEIYKVKDPENINIIRKKVGLETIEEYVKKNNFYYNPL